MTHPDPFTFVTVPVQDQSSETIAERAAWDLIACEFRSSEFSVVNPVGVFGSDYSSSIHIIKRMIDRDIPGCPRLYVASSMFGGAASPKLSIRKLTDIFAQATGFVDLMALW